MNRFPLLSSLLTGAVVAPFARANVPAAKRQKENPAGDTAGLQPAFGRTIETRKYTMELGLVARANGASRPIPRAVLAGPLPLQHIVREGRLVVSPELARRVVAEANFEGQRPVRRPHVAFLADQMRRNSFGAGTQIAFARLPNGELKLVNGQHRFLAQDQTESTIEYQVLIQDAATEEDVARHYYRHDRGQQVRSDAEVLSAVRIVDQYGISKTLARSVFQAQPLIANRFLRPNLAEDPTLRNDDLRLEACKAWWALAVEYEKLIGSAPRLVEKKLKSSQAVAVALVTLKYQNAKARDFWSGIATDDGLRRNDPRKALLIDFANREWGRKSSDGAVVTSLAWNAFYAGRSLYQLKIVNGAAVRILGTPFDGRRA